MDEAEISIAGEILIFITALYSLVLIASDQRHRTGLHKKNVRIFELEVLEL